ncbi:MAG: succinate dehydrogenase iron-sulfur subunit [Deltaproteobacteria bacterium]|nr:succinate dehydrogenase iron-sulfur subunit [Deltaproteobacteria bacterium]MBI3389083.1 succinate dehydrogenase iron-sulfur subunit [Deltaproteobacteria bacterium]
MEARSITLRIKRQDGPGATPYWQEFEIPYKAQHNVLSVLMEVRRNPVTKDGTPTSPVVWEASCLEEVCGSCTMVVNGRVRQACTALVDHLSQPITLEPMTKFPLVRDLVVDRSRMFESLKRVNAWIPIDGTYDLGPGPRVPADRQEFAYLLSRCMTCGCCLEVCPQVNDASKFMGAATMAQVVLFNMHPTGALNKDERLAAVMGEGGIADCGNAQNCVQVCPKEIPLTTAIAELGRQTTIKAVKDLLWG